MNFTADTTAAMRIAFVQPSGTVVTYWDDVTVTSIPKNEGFETGSLSPWLTYATGAGTVTLGGASSAHSGVNSAVLNANNSYAALYQDVYGLVTGSTYSVTVKCKALANNAAPAQLVLHDTTGYEWVTKNFTPTESWQSVTLTFTADSTAAMRIALVQPGGSVATCWDNIFSFRRSCQPRVRDRLSVSLAYRPERPCRAWNWAAQPQPTPASTVWP